MGGYVTAASIKLRAERLRRRQRLHDGVDRSDALLQVLDEATQGLTYRGWEHAVKVVESLWAEGVFTAASIKLRVQRMRREQCLVAFTTATVPMRCCKCSTGRRRGLRTLCGSMTLSPRRADGWAALLRLRASN